MVFKVVHLYASWFYSIAVFSDGAEIADQPDVVLYAAVDKSVFQKNQNKADVVAEAVPEKKGLFFTLFLSSILNLVFVIFFQFQQFNKYCIGYQKYFILFYKTVQDSCHSISD